MSDAAKRPPTWYVFKVREFRRLTDSDDKTASIIEGVTVGGREFTIKVVWDPVFRGSHRKSIETWMKRPKAEFEAAIPYVIAGRVLSRDPLTIEPDTVVPHAPNFGAPPENVY